MNTQVKEKILHRAKIAHGHFKKVIEMIEKNEYCLDITQQTYAIQHALKKIDELILENHLKTCIREAIVTDRNVDERVREIIEVFDRK